MFKSIEKAEEAAAGACLVTSTFLIFIAAVARTVSQPFNWSLDISLFLFAWATFLAADVAFRSDKLVNVDLLIQKVPPKSARVIQIVIYVAIVVFLALLVVYGARLAYTTRERSFQGIPVFSYTWITLSLPVGALLIMRTALAKLLALFREGREAGNGKPPSGQGMTQDEQL